MDKIPFIAWLPVTPRGVAAYATAPLRRLLLAQSGVALVVAVAVAVFLSEAYFPVVTQAILQAPASGEIRQGQLNWQGDTPVFLAENRFLAVSVDLDGATKLRSVAHVQVELGRTSYFVHSLFGYLELDYPRGWIIAANRQELQPLWGAWQPAIVVGAMLSVVVGSLLSWAALATLYFGPVGLLGYICNRQLNASASWKLCGAALLPGALLMAVAISFYVLGVMDLVQMSFIYAAHLIVGWVYLFLGVWFLPAQAQRPKGKENPFAARKTK